MKRRVSHFLGLGLALGLYAFPALAGDFDEAAWRREAARDPLEGIEALRLRLQEPLLTHERARTHALLGALLADELGDLKGGIENYRAALAVDPAGSQSDDVRYALGLALISAHDYAGARKELEFLLQRRPDHPLAFSIRATLADLRTQRPATAPSLPRETLLPRLAPAAPVETAPAAAAGRAIRVLVARDYALEITSDATLFVYGADARELGRARERLACRAQGGAVACGELRAPVLQVIPARGRVVGVAGRNYRGAVVLRIEAGRLAAVNRVSLEQYLYGVLPREVPHDWPAEALKAQAVAARTYAVSRIERAAGLAYDLEDTVLSQVYGGYDAERPGTNGAVDATRGEIMRYGGQPIVAYFHSHSGGRTEDPAYVWGARLPYLVSKDDPHSLKSGAMRWSAEFSQADIDRKLAAELPVGRFKALRVVRRNGSRIELVRVEGERRSLQLSANRLRLLLGPAKLKSTAFTYTQSRAGLRFEGRGYGHGVGMSQWGAMAMAKGGAGYREILSFYYQGVNIERFPAEGGAPGEAGEASHGR